MNTPPAKSQPRRPLRRWLIDLAVVAAAFAAIHWWQTKPLATGPAPALQSRLLDGRPVALADYRGKPVMVHFWATWCPVCKAEQGAIQSLAEDFPVLGVAMESGSETKVRQFMVEQEIAFPTVNDPKGVIAGDWGVKAVPASFIVDAHGVIRFTEVGFSTEPGLRARLWAAEKF